MPGVDRECVTHHNACDCREAAHRTEVQQLQARVATLEGAVRRFDHSQYNCISEQGCDGIIWTVWNGTPSMGRKVASFAQENEAREYLFAARAALSAPPSPLVDVARAAVACVNCGGGTADLKEAVSVLEMAQPGVWE